MTVVRSGDDERGAIPVRLLDKIVIPGRPPGPGPEAMNTSFTAIFAGLCSWVPGSRAKRTPRNDPISDTPVFDAGRAEGLTLPRRGSFDLPARAGRPWTAARERRRS